MRRIRTEGGRLALIAENNKPLRVEEDMGFEVWGVGRNYTGFLKDIGKSR